MNNKNVKKDLLIKTQNRQSDTNDKKENSGIYLRDDHCDWGSSGMNEFTNEFSSN